MASSERMSKRLSIGDSEPSAFIQTPSICLKEGHCALRCPACGTPGIRRTTRPYMPSGPVIRKQHKGIASASAVQTGEHRLLRLIERPQTALETLMAGTESTFASRPQPARPLVSGGNSYGKSVRRGVISCDRLKVRSEPGGGAIAATREPGLRACVGKRRSQPGFDEPLLACTGIRGRRREHLVENQLYRSSSSEGSIYGTTIGRLARRGPREGRKTEGRMPSVSDPRALARLLELILSTAQAGLAFSRTASTSDAFARSSMPSPNSSPATRGSVRTGRELDRPGQPLPDPETGRPCVDPRLATAGPAGPGTRMVAGPYRAAGASRGSTHGRPVSGSG